MLFHRNSQSTWAICDTTSQFIGMSELVDLQ